MIVKVKGIINNDIVFATMYIILILVVTISISISRIFIL